MAQEQTNIKVRFHQTSEEVSVDMETLKEWIDSGRITAEDWIRGDILTGGEWKLAGDMRMFYPGSETAEGSVPTTVWHAQSDHGPDERYPTLRIIAGLLKAVAIMVGIAIIAVIIFALISHGPAVVIPAVLVEGAISIVVLWAFAELINLLIDIADNTRRAADAAERQLGSETRRH